MTVHLCPGKLVMKRKSPTPGSSPLASHVVAVVPLVMLLLISGAQAELEFTEDQMPTVPVPVNGSSGAYCVPATSVTSWNDARTLVLNAFASATVAGCSASSTDALVSSILPAMADVARVLSRLRVDAIASCVNPGDGFACIAATIYANATTSLAIELVSYAVATAMNNCPACNAGVVSASASIMSDLVVKLNEQVSVVANVNVCLGPHQSTTIDVYSNCVAQIHTHAFAYAMASAMISGNCTNLAATATVDVQNMVQVDATCRCSGFEWACDSGVRGNGNGNGGGNGKCQVKKKKGYTAPAFAGLARFPATRNKLKAECSITTNATV